MKRAIAAIRATLATAGVALLITSNGYAETKPTVKGLWVLPDEFILKGQNDPDTLFSESGTKFLATLKKRADSMTEKIISGKAATRDNVLNAAREALDSMPIPGSIFVFYYGGHGVRPGRQNTPPGNAERGSTYLALQGCEVDSSSPPTFSKMIMLEELLLLQSQYEHIYFMAYVDACYSGNQTIDPDLLFRSNLLGPRGFMLCSSGSDRESYNALFSKALIQVYEKDELFNKISNPEDLLNQIKIAQTFPRDQIPQLIPEHPGLEVTYPMPGLCFCVIDFGGFVTGVINVEVSTAGGRPKEYSFNRASGREAKDISMIAFPVQTAKQVHITLNFKDPPEISFDITFSNRWYAYKNFKKEDKIPVRIAFQKDGVITDRDTVIAEYISVLNRAKAFGVDDSGLSGLGIPLATTRTSGLDAARSSPFIAEQARILAELAPTAPEVQELRLVAGIENPHIDAEGFKTLEHALALGFPTQPSLALAYVSHIQQNVSLLKSEPEAAWIQPNELTDKFGTAAAVISQSKSAEAFDVARQSHAAAAARGSEVLNHRDEMQVGASLHAIRRLFH